MLAHIDAVQSPADIDEIKEQVVHQIHESLGDSSWEFILSDRDPELPLTLSTVGMNRFDLPDLVYGVFFQDNSIWKARELTQDLFEYFEANGKIQEGPVDMQDFAEWRVMRHGANSLPDGYPQPKDALCLMQIDKDRFFYGKGYPHRFYYTEEERADAAFLQVYLADAVGKFPWEQGYNYIKQYMFDPRPFGETQHRPKDEVRANRLRYLN